MCNGQSVRIAFHLCGWDGDPPLSHFLLLNYGRQQSAIPILLGHTKKPLRNLEGVSILNVKTALKPEQRRKVFQLPSNSPHSRRLSCNPGGGFGS